MVVRAHDGASLRVVSTIGPVEAGLVPALAAAFEAATGTPVAFRALGTGAALDAARRGEADAAIAHAPAVERAFVADGWGTGRHPFAANDFARVGPPGDPAGVRGGRVAAAALRRIAAAGAPFLSRGGRSGTHVRELELWAAAGVDPTGGRWYAPS